MTETEPRIANGTAPPGWDASGHDDNVGNNADADNADSSADNGNSIDLRDDAGGPARANASSQFAVIDALRDQLAAMLQSQQALAQQVAALVAAQQSPPPELLPPPSSAPSSNLSLCQSLMTCLCATLPMRAPRESRAWDAMRNGRSSVQSVTRQLIEQVYPVWINRGSQGATELRTSRRAAQSPAFVRQEGWAARHDLPICCRRLHTAAPHSSSQSTHHVSCSLSLSPLPSARRERSLLCFLLPPCVLCSPMHTFMPVRSASAGESVRVLLSRIQRPPRRAPPTSR